MSTVELTRDYDGPDLIASLAEHGLTGELVVVRRAAGRAGGRLQRRRPRPRDRGLAQRPQPPARAGADRRLHVHALAARGLGPYTAAHGHGRHEGRRPRARARGGDRLRRDRAGHRPPAGAALRAVPGQPHAGPRGAAPARGARARLVRPEPRRARPHALAGGAPRGVPRARRAGEPGDRAGDAADHGGGACRSSTRPSSGSPS